MKLYKNTNSIIYISFRRLVGFLDDSVVKNLPANGGDVGLIPGLGISTGEGNANPPQHSRVGNPMDRAREIPWTELGGLQSMGSQNSPHIHTIHFMLPKLVFVFQL